ncbi:MAG: hypothetical protein ABIG44_17495 [Planctomycetota bacterium]
MWAFATLCDEFNVMARVSFKLELAPARETLLHFFERLRVKYPRLVRLRRRDDDSLLFDETPLEDGQRRFLRLDNNSLRFGCFNPAEPVIVAEFAELILIQAPCHLSLSDLDYDNLEVVYNFDLEYSGNHDELVAETLLGDGPLHTALLGNHRRVIDCRPCVGVALTDDCRTQAYLEIRSRTSMSEVRSSEYEPQLLSVCLNISRDFRQEPPQGLVSVHDELLSIGQDLVASRIMPLIVQPLRDGIASHN